VDTRLYWKEGFMTRSIDSRVSVEFLKKEAKRWLKLLHAGNSAAMLRFSQALPEVAINDVSRVSLRSVQLAIAREHGMTGWIALLQAIDRRERELRTTADEVLRGAIFCGDHGVAARLFKSHPEIARVNIFTAVAAGDFKEVERQLAIDATAASRAGGPYDWPPLLYLSYMRLPDGAVRSVDIARALLDHGADANSGWYDNWANRFTALTGVIGLGEGVQPTHERSDELVDLLVERGADPCDSQAFYNTSIVSDDVHWLDVLWRHSERLGSTTKWREISPDMIGGNRHMSPLDFMMSLAVSYNHLTRATWLVTHGAHAEQRHPYSGRRLLDEALVLGNETMVELLVRHGAPATHPEARVAFQIACRNMDRNEARRLAERHPECLQDPEPMINAAHSNRADVVGLLLELGVDVDITDADDTRALNVAAGSGALDVIKLLIEHGADVDRPTKHYGGPMGFAAHFNQREAAELLAPHSRDVHNLVYLGMKKRLRELFAMEPHLVDLKHFRTGLTPLFVLPLDDAAALEMANFLLDHGANLSIRNNAGDTPAEDARKRGCNAVAEWLAAALKRG
jgi:uncharacterized protein